jgi:hypothetical protein
MCFVKSENKGIFSKVTSVEVVEVVASRRTVVIGRSVASAIVAKVVQIARIVAGAVSA